MKKTIQQAPARSATKRAAPGKKVVAAKAVESKTDRKAVPAKTEKPGQSGAAKPSKVLKVKKPKPVRDSFTIPKDEYELLGKLKQRAVTLAQPSKKSELLRAGIKALAAMSDRSLLAALKAVPSIKTGRPKKA